MSPPLTPARAATRLPEPLRPRGRGAASNDAGRFERQTREPADDGWSGADEAAPKLRTTLIKDNARTIISRNDSPDISFDRSVNPYRG